MTSFMISQTYSLFLTVFLQIPRNVPNPSNNEPLILSTPFDYFLVIGMPILILIGYYFWRKRKKRESAE